jgi:hypothetical protein
MIGHVGMNCNKDFVLSRQNKMKEKRSLAALKYCLT